MKNGAEPDENADYFEDKDQIEQNISELVIMLHNCE